MSTPNGKVDLSGPIDGRMNGPRYYRHAQMIMLATEEPCEDGCPPESCPHQARVLARAQIYALLALTAAVASHQAVLPVSATTYNAWADALGIA